MKLCCSDCNNILYHHRNNIYEIPLCKTCVENRINNERTEIFKYFKKMVIWGVIICIIFLIWQYKVWINNTHLLFSFIPQLFLSGISYYNGWRFLDKFKVEHIPIPIVGEKIYYALRLSFAVMLGWLATIIILFKKIKKLIELNRELSYL